MASTLPGASRDAHPWASSRAVGDDFTRGLVDGRVSRKPRRRGNRGVTVRVVLETPSDYSSKVSQVTAAGGQVVGYSSSTGFYIHAKAIVADYGTSSAKVFLGSENFSDNSLNHNRELGLIIGDSAVISGVRPAFDSDLAGGAAVS